MVCGDEARCPKSNLFTLEVKDMTLVITKSSEPTNLSLGKLDSLFIMASRANKTKYTYFFYSEQHFNFVHQSFVIITEKSETFYKQLTTHFGNHKTK